MTITDNYIVFCKLLPCVLLVTRLEIHKLCVWSHCQSAMRHGMKFTLKYTDVLELFLDSIAGFSLIFFYIHGEYMMSKPCEKFRWKVLCTNINII